ncbi:HPr kinase/phosphorylase [Caldovatus aquaticus]|uniref:Serine kinase n=1 Tax=Caldovatus aquaticus TaxID=2865671 RepID=A0ABS7F8L9_9PROT|nr:serine kinase [Caldovatus aquaticus]MBW8271176.1 serine kinase [Caldovatus aquaticus]
MLLHGSCAARDGEAVLFLGPPGSGKSDLVLRLLERPGWRLVADDQVVVTEDAGPDPADSPPAGERGTAAPAPLLRVAPPPALRGLLEVRGLGLFADLPVAEGARLRLAVDCAASRDDVPRLPEPARFACGRHALPLVRLYALDGSTPVKVEWALDAATARARMRAGAFAGAPADAGIGG